MKSFIIKSLVAWQELTAGEIKEFPVASGSRQVSVAFNVTEHVHVYASFNKDASDPILVAASDGYFEIGVNTAVDLYIWVDAPLDARIFWHPAAQPQTVGKLDEPTFTGIVPQGRRNSDLDRIMRLVQINNERNAEKLDTTLSELARLKREQLRENRLTDPSKEDKKAEADKIAAMKKAEDEQKAKEAALKAHADDQKAAQDKS